MTSPLLELDHVTKRFGRVVIAEDLSFSVAAGDTVERRAVRGERAEHRRATFE
jgi:ABC-type transporter Mla maintaining outer membrane lipid asymmetry ATPase subunit MlaF